VKIAILHNAVADADSASERDVLVQVSTVEDALRSLGHQSVRLPCTLNLETIEESLTADRPQIVFNLVESLGGSDRLAHLAAVLLEDLDLPYTGTHAAELHLTNNKPRTKQRLRAANLPTPAWAVAEHADSRLSPPYIIKSVWEHASLGIDDHSVITEGDGATVCEQIDSRSRQLGQPCFAEQFIDGREFNLSLIATPDGPRVLPPAEIDFTQFPVGRPRIVGYAAKWDEDAAEYHSTPRSFEFPAADESLLDRLRAISLEIWQWFGLRGYARIDFRIDDCGQPWILEINANPCLSPDAGFAAALVKADISFDRAIEWIVADALATPQAATKSQSSTSGTQSSRIHTSPTTPSPLAAHVASVSPSPPHPSSRSPATDSPTHPLPKLRTKPKRTDPAAVRSIIAATGLFRDAEIDVAEEIIQTRLKKGSSSGYEFLFAEQNKEVIGYICFGRNTLTVSSFDVYWIAVNPSEQGRGIGKLLLEEAEKQIAAARGSRIYIETSHRPDYQPTRGFYERCGYTLTGVLDDFYAPGDGKATYVKVLESTPSEAVLETAATAP
jgi:D-alanine-D-alanine ligase-like ATP-grasp enzyme/ribosomal protein S18 acetylase RimI-like enzyme